jgi:hypothetical protein
MVLRVHELSSEFLDTTFELFDVMTHTEFHAQYP